ncbi:MAG: transcription termination/antitermination NusG family protein [Lachnospiraceae bacterium]|nr:transcription termination/antitermination NusG family protein [Lachnospiraceae bacterium]
MNEHWYILFAQSEKQSQLCSFLHEKGLNAFLPMMEYYRRDRKALAEKPMFPGYIFIKSEQSQREFDNFLFSIKDKTWGLIRQLKNAGDSALTEDERLFFGNILDDKGFARMSYGYLNGDKKAVITQGPLYIYEDRIVKVEKNNGYAYLDFKFMDIPVKAGLILMQKQELREKGLYNEDFILHEQDNQEEKYVANKKKKLEEKKLIIQDELTSEDVEIDLNVLISKMSQL